METLPLLYRDDYLVAINKPSGLLVHRSPIDRHETRFALQLLRDQLGQRVYPLHRLDKPTSGVLLFALSPDVARAMGDVFQQRRLEKRYLAVVRGFAPETGFIDHPLTEELDKLADRDAASDKAPQSAQTSYTCLATHELPVCIETYPVSRYSLLLCEPHTGRKHQIRRHLKHINHPIIGDAKHGRGRHNRYFKEHLDTGRLLLHACSLTFPHPFLQQTVTVNAGIDATLQNLFQTFKWCDQVPAQWHHSPEEKELHP